MAVQQRPTWHLKEEQKEKMQLEQPYKLRRVRLQTPRRCLGVKAQAMLWS